MDLREIARSRRRSQALDALQFERDREAALREQLEETATELEGPSVDEETFARMTPADAETVRHVLFDPGDDSGHEPERGEEWLEEFFEADEVDDFDREERLGEVARLEGEIEESRRRQEALERYVEALAAPGA